MILVCFNRQNLKTDSGLVPINFLSYLWILRNIKPSEKVESQYSRHPFIFTYIQQKHFPISAASSLSQSHLHPIYVYVAKIHLFLYQNYVKVRCRQHVISSQTLWHGLLRKKKKRTFTCMFTIKLSQEIQHYQYLKKKQHYNNQHIADIQFYQLSQQCLFQQFFFFLLKSRIQRRALCLHGMASN